MFLCTFLLIYKLITSAKLNKSYHYVVQPTFSLKGFIFVSIRTKTACGIKCGSGHQTENGKAPKRVLYHHYVGHWRAFCELKWRYWHFSPLGYSRDCSDCFLVIFSAFIASMPSKVMIIVIQVMILGINMFWASHSHYNPRLAARAKKDSESGPNSVFFIATLGYVPIFLLVILASVYLKGAIKSFIL